MLLTTRVKLILSESPSTGIPGTKVSLFDRDLNDPDDHLSTGVTDTNGEILFKFDSDQDTDSEDSELWRLDSMPDLYIIIYDREGEMVISTRSEALENKLPDLITVPLNDDLVQKHNLI